VSYHLKHDGDGHLMYSASGHLVHTCDGCDCNGLSPDTTTQSATITLTCGDCTNIPLGTPSYSSGTWTWSGSGGSGCTTQTVALSCKVNGNWELSISAYANNIPDEACWATVEIPCDDIAVVGGKFVPPTASMDIPATCDDPSDSPVTLVWA